jgi:hypothetical protein
MHRHLSQPILHLGIQLRVNDVPTDWADVRVGGAKSWIYRYMLNGRSSEMGLGPLHIILLSEARSRAAESRRMRLDGIDPIEARKVKLDEAKLEAAKAISFDACAKAYIDARGRVAERETPRSMT